MPRVIVAVGHRFFPVLTTFMPVHPVMGRIFDGDGSPLPLCTGLIYPTRLLNGKPPAPSANDANAVFAMLSVIAGEVKPMDGTLMCPSLAFVMSK